MKIEYIIIGGVGIVLSIYVLPFLTAYATGGDPLAGLIFPLMPLLASLYILYKGFVHDDNSDKDIYHIIRGG